MSLTRRLLTVAAGAVLLALPLSVVSASGADVAPKPASQRPSALSCALPPPGMVGWWRAEGNATDSALDNDGTFMNGATTGAGFVGDAFVLDGINDFIQVPDTATTGLTGSITIDAWIFLDAYSPEFAPIVSKWNDLTGAFRSYFLAVINGQLRFDVSTNGFFAGNNSFIAIGGSVPLGQWVHVAGRFDNSTRVLSALINGVVVGSATATFTSVFDNAEPLLIGAGDLGSNVRDFFDGRIDEVELIARALSNSEIASIAAAGITGKCLPDEVAAASRPNQSGFAAAVAAVAGQQARENRARVAAAAQPAPAVVPPSTGTGITIIPPNTGDGGLASSEHNSMGGVLAAGLAVLLAAGFTLRTARGRR